MSGCMFLIIVHFSSKIKKKDEYHGSRAAILFPSVVFISKLLSRFALLIFWDKGTFDGSIIPSQTCKGKRTTVEYGRI
jgi:hypothetical protein